MKTNILLENLTLNFKDNKYYYQEELFSGIANNSTNPSLNLLHIEFKEGLPICDKVMYDDLEYDPTIGLYRYNGKIFTGIMFGEYDEETEYSERFFLEGEFYGFGRTWYVSRKLKSQDTEEYDREWYENGQLASEKIVDRRRIIKKRTWDEVGNLLTEENFKGWDG